MEYREVGFGRYVCVADMLLTNVLKIETKS